MTRLLIQSLVLALLIGLGASVEAQGDKVPETREIMARLNKPTGIYFALTRELKDAAPEWDDARTQSKTLSLLAAALPKNAPPKGDKASWDKLARAYADNAKAVEEAVKKMDKAAAQAALTRMGEPFCTNCHKAHRK